MEKPNKNLLLIVLAVCLGIGFIALIVGFTARGTGSVGSAAPLYGSQAAAAAGAFPPADNFAVLASTYTNVATTTINGDLGYTTGPGVTPTVSGSTHVADGAYSLAGTNQGSALSSLNAQSCDFNFGSDTDLSLLPQPLVPGTYCVVGAASVGTGGITLSGSGTYTFRMTGALTTVANSAVSLAGGASACDVFWTPGAATTLGANSTFIGTDIDASGISIGSTIVWTGRALSFGGTVTTNADTITAPSCGAPPAPATLHLIKLVVNGNGGMASSSDFMLHVKLSGTDVSGSPATGTPALGRTYTLAAGTYAISEDAHSGYVQSFGTDCTSGSVTLAPGDDKICTVINTDIPPPAPLITVSNSGIGGAGRAVPLIGITKVPSPLALPKGGGSVTYNYTVWNVSRQQALVNVTVTDDKCGPVSLVSGDLNSDGKLDLTEYWKYSCTAKLSTTTTNTAVAVGYSDDPYHQAAIATAIATVAVGGVPGLPNTGLLPPPLINIVKVPSQLTPFPFGGGPVTYTYTVTNPGVVPLHAVTVIDDVCKAISGPSGDSNANGMLDPGESWLFTCRMNISVSTRNIATARGSANGFTALGYAFATVLVSSPSLPNTGFPPEEGSSR